MTDKLMVTAQAAAEILSISLSQVYILAASGVLEKRYIGKGAREFRIPVSSLEAYVQSLPTERAS